MKIEDFINENRDFAIKKYVPEIKSIVYFICEEDGEIIYIGSTMALHTRLKMHNTKIEFYNKPVFFFTQEPAECKENEKNLILAINPKYNIQWASNNVPATSYDTRAIAFSRIKKKIMKVMADKEITQSELARRMNMSRQRIHQLIKDENFIRKPTLRKIEKALEVKLLT